MNLAATVRKLFVGSLMATIACTIVASGWLLWPVYQEYEAVQKLERAAAEHNHAAFDEALARLQRLRNGVAAVDALSDVMQSNDAEVRYWAVRRLGRLAVEREQVIPALLEATADPERQICLSATESLQKQGALAVPELLAMLASGDSRQRAGALDGLGTIGPAAMPARATIRNLLHDPDDRVREWAVWALGQIDPHDEAVVRVIIEMLGDSVIEVKWAATQALRKSKPATQILVMEAVRSHARETVRAGAAWAVADDLIIDDNGRETLLAALRDPSARVRAAAAGSIGRLGLRPGSDQDFWSGGNAGITKPVEPLRSLLTDEHASVRVAGAGALLRFGGEASKILPILIEGVDHSEDDCRYWAISGLAEFGPASRGAVPRIIDALKDQDKDVRAVAAYALGCIRCDPERTVRALISALEDTHPQTRQNAVTALRGFGRDAKPAREALRTCLDDADEYVRLVAADALEKLQQTADTPNGDQ